MRPVGGTRVEPLLVAGAFVVLTAVYCGVGDTTVLGECLTVWPPFVWCAILAPRCVLLAWRRRFRALTFVLACGAGFLLLTVEWASCLRRADPQARARFDALRLDPQAGRALRVVNWNVAGGMPLADLEALAPDLCLLQEIGAAEPLRGPWQGFHWQGALDPGTLSRHPIHTLATRKVGPWTEPQVLRLDLPGGRRLVVINVRLMLPALVVATAELALPSRLGPAHQERVGQFELLAGLLEDTLREQGATAAILCGDFNTPGGAASLAPLQRMLSDVWPASGVGWGATMTATLPVSRIDQCWVTAGLRPVAARVERGDSDHRLLVVDLLLGAE